MPIGAYLGPRGPKFVFPISMDLAEIFSAEPLWPVEGRLGMKFEVLTHLSLATGCISNFGVWHFFFVPCGSSVNIGRRGLNFFLDESSHCVHIG